MKNDKTLTLAEVQAMTLYGPRVVAYSLFNDTLLDMKTEVTAKVAGEMLRETNEKRMRVINVSEESKERFSIGDIVLLEPGSFMPMEVILREGSAVVGGNTEVRGIVFVAYEASVIAKL